MTDHVAWVNIALYYHASSLVSIRLSDNTYDKILRSLFSHFRPLMKQKLEQGINLVVDRYAFSGVAFTSAKPVSVILVKNRIMQIMLRYLKQKEQQIFKVN